MIVPQPTDGKPSPGTGLLVRLRGMPYFVTALHNFFHDFGGMDQVLRSWSETRFKFRESEIGRTESLNAAVHRVKSRVGSHLPLPRAETVLIDKKHDLIAVSVDLSMDVFAHAEFIDLESECFTKDLTSGLSLVSVGVTLSSQVHVPGVGPTLIPQIDHVRFDPETDTSGTTHQWYSPEYFFMPFSLLQDGIDPHGFSGSPIFVNKEPTGAIWTAAPHVVGLALDFFRSKRLLIVVKIETVVDLLNRDTHG